MNITPNGAIQQPQTQETDPAIAEEMPFEEAASHVYRLDLLVSECNV